MFAPADLNLGEAYAKVATCCCCKNAEGATCCCCKNAEELLVAVVVRMQREQLLDLIAFEQ